uniref:HNH domain-containing protein n=1 Tax=Chaetoceros debilis TaxID=122233 RepID=A0A7S3PU05_9STRA
MSMSKIGPIPLSIGVVVAAIIMFNVSKKRRAQDNDNWRKDKKGGNGESSSDNQGNGSGKTTYRSLNHNSARQASLQQDERSMWSDEHLPSHLVRERMKEKRRKEKIPMLTMKSKMYDNITLCDPQGEALSKISKKKANWYIKKGLADFIDGKEDSVRLKFEPKARSQDADYGMSTKKNVCVACGEPENQMRFYIVPYAYRHLFPEKYKQHISHDIVSLCANCHLLCGQQTQIRMDEIEEKFNIVKKYSTDHRLYKVRSSALALMNWRLKIPAEKVSWHIDIVRRYLIDDCDLDDSCIKDETIPKDLLQKACDIDFRVLNTAFVPGPDLVVASMADDDEKLAKFIRAWRVFFLETIHPRHLPQGWSIEYPVHCMSTDYPA